MHGKLFWILISTVGHAMMGHMITQSSQVYEFLELIHIPPRGRPLCTLRHLPKIHLNVL